MKVPKEFIPELTVKENLMIPLTFAGILKATRDRIVNVILESHDLTEWTETYPQRLGKKQQNALLKAYKDVSSHYPSYEVFLRLLDTRPDLGNCLFIIHHELFVNIAHNLMEATAAINKKDYGKAAGALSKAVDRLALRIALSPYIDIPSRRVLQVLVMTIRTYYDVLRLRKKVDQEFLKKTVKKATAQFGTLADAFIETAHIEVVR